jgi:hypothetical protein
MRVERGKVMMVVVEPVRRKREGDQVDKNFV